MPSTITMTSLTRVARGIAPATAIVLLFSFAAPSKAQNARVYVANSSNSRIELVQFDPISTTVVNNDANLLAQVRDISIRDDGLDGVNLIVCDRNGGKVVFYQNASGLGQIIFYEAIAAGPDRPDGASLY